MFTSAVLLICFVQSAAYGQIVTRSCGNEIKPKSDAMPPGDASASHRPRPLHVDVDLVMVPVTVSDSLNHTVTSLKKEDFALYEENQQQEIRYFSTEDDPISVAILLDVSKSMTDKIETERAAIVEFFNNANPEDEYFAIALSPARVG
jgi:Ca-activated chloride channel family protein